MVCDRQKFNDLGIPNVAEFKHQEMLHVAKNRLIVSLRTTFEVYTCVQS